MSEQPYSIGEHRGGYVLVHYRDGKRHRHSLGTRDKDEARRRAPTVWAEISRPVGRTVANLWQAYRQDKAGRAVLVTMEHTWKALRDRFGQLHPDHITIEHCRSHTAARRAAGIGDGTIHTELGHLRMVLLWAVKHGLIDKAPAIERPSKPPPKEKHLTIAEVRRLVDACEMLHLRLFVHLAYATAGRSAAILGLTWDRVDFQREKIDLRDPTMTTPHKGRAIVPMTRTVKVQLFEARRGAQSEYVIEWAGERVRTVKKGLATASRKAGLPKVSPHMLRHSAAVRQAETGVPMEEIASHLGHRNVNVTRSIYAKFSPDALRRSAAALELDDDFGTQLVQMYQSPKSNAPESGASTAAKSGA